MRLATKTRNASTTGSRLGRLGRKWPTTARRGAGTARASQLSRQSVRRAERLLCRAPTKRRSAARAQRRCEHRGGARGSQLIEQQLQDAPLRQKVGHGWNRGSSRDRDLRQLAPDELPPKALLRAQLVGQRAHAVEHGACQQRVADVDMRGLQVRQSRQEGRYARQAEEPVAPRRDRLAGRAHQRFRQPLIGKLQRLDFVRGEVVGERREARLGAHGVRRAHVRGPERVVPANHAVEALVEQRLPHAEAVDISRNSIDAPFAEGEEPPEDDLGIGAAGLDRNESMRYPEDACDLARHLRVVAVLLLTVRKSPRHRSHATVAQQAEKAAAVRAARQCQHPLARVEGPPAASVNDGRAQSLQVGVV